MQKAKVSYIIQSSLGMAVWTLLTVIVSLKVSQEHQLALTSKFAFWGLLWGIEIYFILVLHRYYRKLVQTTDPEDNAKLD
jgi:hypothetical protein